MRQYFAIRTLNESENRSPRSIRRVIYSAAPAPSNSERRRLCLWTTRFVRICGCSSTPSPFFRILRKGTGRRSQDNRWQQTSTYGYSKRSRQLHSYSSPHRRL